MARFLKRGSTYEAPAALNDSDVNINSLVDVIENGGGGEPTVQVVYQVKKVLTHSEILALPSSFIQVVPAPGANKLVVPIGTAVTFKFTDSGAITGADVDNEVFLAYGDWDASATNSCRMFTDSGDDRTAVLVPLLSPSGASVLSPLSSTGVMANAPIKIAAYNNSGDFAGGHANHTMEIVVTYMIVDL